MQMVHAEDTCRYYLNSNIKACLVLKAPDGSAAVPDGLLRMQCSSAYDANKGMANVQMVPLSNDVRLSDQRDHSRSFPPLVTRFTATVAQPPTSDYLMMHRMMEIEFAGLSAHVRMLFWGGGHVCMCMQVYVPACTCALCAPALVIMCVRVCMRSCVCACVHMHESMRVHTHAHA